MSCLLACLIDWIVFYAVSVMFQPYYGGDIVLCGEQHCKEPRRGSRKFFQGGGGPTLTYNCGRAQIWKITIFCISSNIGDIKLCTFQAGGSAWRPLCWMFTHVIQAGDVIQGLRITEYSFTCFYINNIKHKHSLNGGLNSINRNISKNLVISLSLHLQQIPPQTG